MTPQPTGTPLDPETETPSSRGLSISLILGLVMILIGGLLWWRFHDITQDTSPQRFFKGFFSVIFPGTDRQGKCVTSVVKSLKKQS